MFATGRDRARAVQLLSPARRLAVHWHALWVCSTTASSLSMLCLRSFGFTTIRSVLVGWYSAVSRPSNIHKVILSRRLPCPREVLDDSVTSQLGCWKQVVVECASSCVWCHRPFRLHLGRVQTVHRSSTSSFGHGCIGKKAG